VRINDPDRGWLRIVSMAYGLPTIGMIFGAVAGYWAAMALQQTHLAELTSLLGFFLGLTGGLFAWDRAEKRVRPTTVRLDQADAVTSAATIVGVVANSGEQE